MASINKIKPGQTLYDCHKTRMGNTTLRTMGIWSVLVIEVDIENKRALCSWNTNQPTWWHERNIKKLKVSRPASKAR